MGFEIHPHAPEVRFRYVCPIFFQLGNKKRKAKGSEVFEDPRKDDGMRVEIRQVNGSALFVRNRADIRSPTGIACLRRVPAKSKTAYPCLIM
jgi:hypothetical protein